MWHKYFIQALSGLLVSMVTLATMAKTPSTTQIIDWISNSEKSYASPANKIVIEHSEEITLLSGEKAYVSGIEFVNAGRNFVKGYILTRPALKQSHILQFGGQSNTFVVHQVIVKGKPVNLVEFEGAGSGQGTIGKSRTLAYFKNWQPITIAEARSYYSPGQYDDKLGDSDCKTGANNIGILNVLEQQSMVLKTEITGNACASRVQDYKIQSKLIPIVLK
ncbi:hypothetical protein GCM10023206_12910 [Acinetobacter puyangensis]|uniref:Uncharacterized protein n=2 Tax=Acinetobacter puyangensis TaxID=1096779 RepID=A0A240E8N6_9GAMM|nr:hypothetical protein [Acinetobacter puyangensis]SNX44992.1 hypothetical protein SAMN05421731_104358 [Acinetobacter puyangensis]